MIVATESLSLDAPREKKPYFSPSQIKSAKSCPRKWSGETVQGWRQPDTPSTNLGKQTHEVLQQYLEQTLDHDLTPTRQPEAVLLPALKFFPHPSTPHLLCEQEVLIPAATFDTGKDLFGFLDVMVLLHYDEELDADILLVADLKTTSNLVYMKCEEELRADPQALIYSWAGLQKCIEDMGIEHTHIRFRHVYARTKGGSAGAESSVVFTVEELKEGLSALAAFCQQMLLWEDLPFDQVPYNTDSCGKYGGCHLRPECAKTGLPVFGDSPGRAVAATLSLTRQDQPRSKETPKMSKAMKEALARKAALASAGNAMAAMLGAAPSQDILNPPDGDVQGISGIQEAPTDVQPDEAAIPAPAAVPSPDAGYVEQDKVLPPKAEKAAGRRGAGKSPTQWTKLQTTLSRLLNNDELAAQVQQLDDQPLLQQMLEGKAKETSGPEVLALQLVLDAVENGTYRVVGEAVPVEGDKESDKLQAAIQETKRAVVVAKDALAKATKQFRELEDGDDEEAAEKFRAEVFLPAKRNVKVAEERQVAQEAELVKVLEEEAAAEVRRLQELEREQAKAKAVEEVQVREEVVEQTAVTPEVPLVARSVWGIEGTILIKGAVPTRQWKAEYTHIDDIINPYRRRAEQQAMTSYYGAMKTDGDARICELLMADIITGNYKLPKMVVAPAMCTRLQDRVIDAISLYLVECFQPLR